MPAAQSALTLNTPAIPPLESGDRLTRPEFERRYAVSRVKKAELIEGVVYVASPLRHEQHGKPHSRVITCLGVYQAQTPGVDLSDAPTVRLDHAASRTAISGPPSLCPAASGPVATNYSLAEFRRNYKGPVGGQTHPVASQGRSPLGPQ